MMTSDVSRETSEMLEAYSALVRRWTKRINLVSRADVENLGPRHIDDSLAVARMVSDPVSWIDIGSGGGFPGIVAAIFHRRTLRTIHLVESDQRKCAFLRTCARELALDVDVHADRIEQIDLPPAPIVSARALAPLGRLLGYARPLIAPGGVGLFPKGVGWKVEVDAALETWRFDLQTEPSRTNPGSVILKVSNVEQRSR